MFKQYRANIRTALAQLKDVRLLRGTSWAYRFDLLVNAILFGDPQETISSRLGKYLRAGNRGVVYVICRLLSFIDSARGNHCLQSIDDNQGSDELIRVEVLLIIAALVTGLWWWLA